MKPRLARFLMVGLISWSSVIAIDVIEPRGLEASVVVTGIDRLNVTDAGVQSPGQSLSTPPAINYDGSQVAFNHLEPLIPDPVGRQHLYVRDLRADRLVEIGLQPNGLPVTNGDAFAPDLDASGRFVAFWSTSSQLVLGDGNNRGDLFITDRDFDANGIFDEVNTANTVVVNRPASVGVVSSTLANGGDPFQILDAPSLSNDGRFVAFRDNATNLVADDTNNCPDIFIHDRDVDTNGAFDEPAATMTIRVSVSSSGSQGVCPASGGTSSVPSLSGNGRFVVFFSNMSGLVDGITGPIWYIHDRDSDNDGAFDEVGAVSTSSLATAFLPQASDKPSIDDAGRRIMLFTPQNLSPIDTGFPSGDTYIIDRDLNGDGIFQDGEVAYSILRSPSSNFRNVYGSTLSADGRGLAFAYDGTNETPQRTPLMVRYDGQAPVRVDDSPQATLYSSFDARLSGDGTSVVYMSSGSQLVPGDTNGRDDLFISRIAGGSLESLAVSLTSDKSTVPPGVSSIDIADIPIDAIRTLGFDVASSSPVQQAPTLRRKSSVRNFASLYSSGALSGSSLVAIAPTLRRKSPLSDTPLSLIGVEGGWDDRLVGTIYERVPLQSITFQQVLDLVLANPSSPDLGGLEIDDLDFTSPGLVDLSPAAVYLGNVRVDQLVFAVGQTWCQRLLVETSKTCAELAIGDRTMVQLDLDPEISRLLDAHPSLRNPPIGVNVSALRSAGSPVLDAPLAASGLAVSRLGRVSLALAVNESPELGAKIAGEAQSGVVCGAIGFDCSTSTLAQALTSGALLPGATIRSLGSGVAGVSIDSIIDAAPSDLTLSDVLLGFLENADYPWEQLDLIRTSLQAFDSSSPEITFSATISTTGVAAPIGGTVNVELPPGFRYVPSTTAVTPPPVSPVSEPFVETSDLSTRMTWTLSGLSANAPVTLSFRANPGVKLGSFQVVASGDIASLTASSAPLEISVVESDSAGGSPAQAQEATGDRLYFGYITDQSDIDLYSFSPQPGQNVGVRLSNFDGDADLVLYGPRLDDPNASSPSASSDRTVGGDALIGGIDVGGMIGLGADTPESNTSSDVQVLDGRTIVATATSDEAVVEGAEGKEANLIQVSYHEGQNSDQPYVLRIRPSFPADPGPCSSPYFLEGGVSGIFDKSTLPGSLQTVILIDRQRFSAAFGETETLSTVAKLDELAALPSVGGAVVFIDGVPTIASATSAWNADSCSPSKANAVVRAVSTFINSLRLDHPELRNVVLVGSDSQVPFARLADVVSLGNEAEYASSLPVGSPMRSAAAGGFMLTDDPYIDRDPIPFLNRRLYIPDLAIGRLVETPADIRNAVDAFVLSNGLLSGSSAYVSGYDFMEDGAASLSDAIAAVRSLSTFTRINSGWTRNEILADLESNRDINGLYGHFAHDALLSANGFTQAQFSDVATPADLAAKLLPGSRLVMSMGCHSGTSLPGGGANEDFAERLLGTGAAYVAVSGFGFGDQATVGLHEKLMALFAKRFDGTVSVGEALRQAKQEYFRQQGLYGDADMKTINTTIFFGLPMYQFASVGGSSVSADVASSTVVPSPVEGSDLFSHDVTFDPTFTEKTTSVGNYFVASLSGGDFEPLVVSGQPIQPRLSADITVESQGSILPAHGVLVTDFSVSPASDYSAFDAAFARPVIDFSGNEPESPFSETSFPSRMAVLSTYESDGGLPGADGNTLRQDVVLIPGRYLGDGVPDPQGVGIQELFEDIGVRVFYSESTDYVEPTVRSTKGTVLVDPAGISPSTVQFTVDADDPSGVHRVVVLYRTATIDWSPLELASSGGSWTGSASLPPGTETVSYSVQVVDGAGNVAVVSGKGSDIIGAPVPPPDPPRITIVDAVTAEGDGSNGTVDVLVTLDRVSPSGISIPWSLTDGTATAGNDFVAGSGSLVVDAGDTSGVITVSIVADDVSESIEAFQVSLGANPSYELDRSASNITITDDDNSAPVGVSVSATASVSESGGSVQATVSLSRALVGSTAVTYVVNPSTATRGGDFTATSGTLNFPGGSTTQTFSIPILNDSRYEVDEEFQVAVFSNNLNLVTPSFLVTIVDDDPQPSVSTASVVVTEGSTAEVPVTLDAISGAAVMVSYSVSAGTAGSGDFTPKTGTVEIPEGSSSGLILVPTVDNSDPTDGSRTVIVTLSAPVNATLGSPSSATVTIQNDDVALPEVSIEASKVVSEGNSGTASASLTVSLSKVWTSAVSVSAASSDGSASAGSDYTAVSQVVTIPVGETSTTVSVPIVGDTSVEVDEAFSVTLSAPVNATLGSPSSATVTIQNDDVAPSLTGKLFEASVFEGDTIRFVVALSGPAPMSLSIPWQATAGSAALSDLRTTSGTLTISSGATFGTIALATREDRTMEPDSFFELTISPPMGLVVSAEERVVQGRILDDDGSGTRVRVGDCVINEGATGTTSCTVTIEFSRKPRVAVSLSIGTANGTAVSSEDFISYSSTLTTTRATVKIPLSIIGDAIAESTEGFSLDVIVNSGASSADVSGLIIIANDD